MYLKPYELVQVRIGTDIRIGKIVKGPINGRYFVCFNLDIPNSRLNWATKDSQWIDRTYIVRHSIEL